MALIEAVGARENFSDDELFAGVLERLACFRGMGDAEMGVEDAEQVVDFGDRSDGAARVEPPRFLLESNRRGESFELVDFRLRELLDHSPGIGGERFGVAALPFGVERFEGKR